MPFFIYMLDKILKFKFIPRPEQLLGLEFFRKVFNPKGIPCFLSKSDLDLDTDGVRDPKIKYESTNQSQTSIDPNAEWCNSNTINYVVIPGKFQDRNGGIGLGTLCTVFYKDKIAHAIIGDFGPKTKYGEGSINLHRQLGYERIKNGRIQDIGISSGVYILFYINSKISKLPCTQKQIDEECSKLLNEFTVGN